MKTNLLDNAFFSWGHGEALEDYISRLARWSEDIYDYVIELRNNNDTLIQEVKEIKEKLQIDSYAYNSVNEEVTKQYYNGFKNIVNPKSYSDAIHKHIKSEVTFHECSTYEKPKQVFSDYEKQEILSVISKFEENHSKYYIARNENNSVDIYSDTPPERLNDEWGLIDFAQEMAHLNKLTNHLKFLKWEDEPIEIKTTIEIV